MEAWTLEVVEQRRHEVRDPHSTPLLKTRVLDDTMADGRRVSRVAAMAASSVFHTGARSQRTRWALTVGIKCI